MFALLGAQEPDRAPPVRTITETTVRLEDRVLRGFVLPNGDRQVLLMVDREGRFREVPWELIGVPEETAERPVTEIPSHALATGLGYPDELTRNRCERLLVEQGEVAHEALADPLRSSDDEVRWRALRVLWHNPSKKLAAAVRRCLRHAEPKVRRHALRAYAEIHPGDLYDRCEAVLTFEHDDWVRHEALSQLGPLGDLRAVDLLLEELVQSENESLRLRTFESLRRLTGHRFGSDERKWRSWWKSRREEVLAAQREGRDTPALARSIQSRSNVRS